MTPQKLRADLLRSDTDDMKRRRAVIGLSLVGMAALSLVTLRQTGMIKRLPDVPIKGFDADAVNTSEEAYRFGTPDGTLGAAGFALNLPLAALGDADRARKQPWAALLMAGKACVDAAVSGYFLYQEGVKEKCGCGYCLTAALANFGICALTLPEAKRAWETLREESDAEDEFPSEP